MSFHTAQDVIDWVHSLQHLGMKPGLERMEWMMRRLGHPERTLKFVHIGGTNGKGSTLTFMRHVLERAGYQVGSFTSPYLTRFEERIQLNGHPIEEKDLLDAAQHIKVLVDELSSTELGSPTEFEVLTALAIYYFARIAYPDVVLWEVGLGGRLDSTNIVIPLVSIITNVGHDHQSLLGEHITEIAEEKAGIIKPGVPVVTAVTEEEAFRVLQEKAAQHKASLYRLGDAFHVEIVKRDDQSQTISYRSWFNRYTQLRLQLLGAHQARNAAVALMGLELLKQYYALIWDEDELREGLAQAEWAGRLETLVPQVLGESSKNGLQPLESNTPFVLLDGAHNPEGMAALSQALKEHYPGKKWTVIFAALKEKQVVEMIRAFDPSLVEKLILTQFEAGMRTRTADELQDELGKLEWPFEVRVEPDWQVAYQNALRSSKPENRSSEEKVSIGEVNLLFTGSIHFVAEVRQALLNLRPS